MLHDGRAKTLIENHGGDVNIADKSGTTLLHEACSIGDIAAVRGLLAHGASVRALTVKRRSCLHSVCAIHSSKGDEEALMEIVKEIVAAVDSDADFLNLRSDSDGLVAAENALLQQRYSTVKFLVECGTDAAQFTRENMKSAKFFRNRNPPAFDDVIQFLTERGAPPME